MLGLGVLRSVIQVTSCLIQQSSGFRKIEPVFINQQCKRLRVWYQTIARWPIGILDIRKLHSPRGLPVRSENLIYLCHGAGGVCR
jgi:hypothetical protein